MINTSSFTDASAANQDFGGFAKRLDYFANGQLPLLYPPSSTPGSLAQVRRARALRWRKPGTRLMVLPPAPLASGVDCNGANKADNQLTFVSLGLGAAGLLGCIPCPFIGLSHLLPLMVVKAIKFFYW